MRLRGQLAGSVLISAGLIASVAAAPAQGAGVAHKKARIATVKTSLGRVVSNPRGRVMFRFLKDGRNKSRCTATCRSVWPPVMSKHKARAGAHIAGSHLGRTKRGQVTYYHHPLYYFSGDPKPGKTTGDGTKEFGDRWYIVSPTGKSVKPAHQSSGGGVTPPTGPADVSTGTVGTTTVLTSANGHTLYELSSETDTPPSFTCTGSCTSLWPPLLTKGAPTASGSADASKLGTVSRSIGGKTYTQVTYNHHPLYDYSDDHSAGSDNGEGLYDPPGYWYELTPNGLPH